MKDNINELIEKCKAKLSHAEISRYNMCEQFGEHCAGYGMYEDDVRLYSMLIDHLLKLKELEAPKEISYEDCANAMLKMWIDNVLTDYEYYKIMDGLNKQEIERRSDI